MGYYLLEQREQKEGDRVVQEQAEQSTAPPRRTTWWDLVLYLVGGLGLYFLVSLGLALAFRETSILSTFALYTANMLVLGGAVYLLGVRRGKLSWAEIGFLPAVWRWRWVWLAIGISIVAFGYRVALAAIVQALLGDWEGLWERWRLLSAAGGFSWLSFGLTFLGAAVLAPISEELYFRGLIHRWFVPRMGLWPRVLLSSAIFGLAHLAPAVIVSAFVLGAVNAFVLEKTRSIWLPILLHMMTNAVAVIATYILLAIGYELRF